MSSDAAAALGFVALFALILLRVPVGMAMGLVGVTGYASIVGAGARAEDGRPDLDAHGHRLHVRRHPDVPAHGRLRLGVRHEPRIVPRREQFCRALAGRAGAGDDRRLRRLRRDQRLVGRNRRDLRHRRLSRDAAVRLSAILRRRGHRGRRHARRDLSALDGARRLRPHHPAGHRQAVHRRHPSRPARGLNVHADHRRDRLDQAGLSARRPAQRLGRTAAVAARRVGRDRSLRLRDRRPLRRPVHADGSGRGRRMRRLPDLGRAGEAQARGRACRAFAGDAHRGCGVHRFDRRAPVRLFPHRHRGLRKS